MGFDVPEPYVWDESFRVNYDNIDTEHQGLFKAIFDCSKAPGDGGKLSHLATVVGAHFATEEKMFAAANYSDAASHTKVHADFLAKVKGLSAPLSDDTVAFAKNWLVNHIKGTDTKYKGKL
uniref:Hemerythrin n=1 Tax=Cossura longocirrata TaxID=1964453 RepID=A0A1S6QCY1_9ANNE|nr:hemerythrin [Cossura longocirrata]